MKLSLFSLVLAAATCGYLTVSTTVAQAGSSPADVRAKAKAILAVLPDSMPGSEKDSRDLIQLGRKLYFDKLLSVNQSQSCNTCHAVDQNQAGVDNERTSEGAFGKRGARNSPTVLNAGLHFAQFWDGRAPTLEEQAKGPILNPVEMAMPNDKEVLKRVGEVKEYQTMFAKAFPDAAEKITYDNMARAIAAFERTLITHDRFDDFMKGNDRALSAAELKGLETFLEIGCTTCHTGPAIGASSFQKVGLINAYENTSDFGRFDVTKEDSDKFKFKVPSLRNVALTGPYFHDGATANLEQAVTKMAWMQLGRKLTADETQSLVAFLNTLSDKSRAAKAKNRASLK
jgi:cytochrome c peroxidase